MTFFTSEYESKLDSKGRLVLPARVKAQLPEGDNELVIRRGFEPCLVIYPRVEFFKVYSQISGLNEFQEENRVITRNIFSRVAEVEIDSAGRFVIPKSMLTYAQLEKDVILVGAGTKVEVWNPSLYEKYLIQDQSELSKLAAKYLG